MCLHQVLTKLIIPKIRNSVHSSTCNSCDLKYSNISCHVYIIGSIVSHKYCHLLPITCHSYFNPIIHLHIHSCLFVYQSLKRKMNANNSNVSAVQVDWSVSNVTDFLGIMWNIHRSNKADFIYISKKTKERKYSC